MNQLEFQPQSVIQYEPHYSIHKTPISFSLNEKFLQDQNLPSGDSDFNFNFELNEIKFFHKCLINIKSQFDFLREFIENENKDTEFISNTKNSFFDKFFTQTAKFSKEPSEIFNHTRNFVNFLFQYLNTNSEEIMNNQNIYNHISEFIFKLNLMKIKAKSFERLISSIKNI